jgi:hypothetical protein
MAICNAISECGTITAAVECLAAVVQGESYHYEIQLTNAHLKHQMGNNALPLRIDDKILSKALLAFDKLLVGK